jgi:DNA-binding CsgD family transcriptional regulator
MLRFDPNQMPSRVISFFLSSQRRKYPTGTWEHRMREMAFLQNRFGLTPAEARLVVHLVTGASLRSCGNALGISYETARGYLKSAFQKTGTHRQAELVLTVFGAMSDPNPPPPPASPPRKPGSSSSRQPIADPIFDVGP